MNLPSKSKFALCESLKTLPVSSHGNLYLWTFTFADCLGMDEARKRWSDFLRHLRIERKRKGDAILTGFRVFELHPGGHGLHVHVATGCYLRVNQVRRLWKMAGGGRIHVKPIAANRIGYVAKYISKQGRPDCLKSARMWAPLGKLDYTRVKDVTIENNWTRIFYALKMSLGSTWEHLRWHEKQQGVANVERNLPWAFGLGLLRQHQLQALGAIFGQMPGLRPF